MANRIERLLELLNLFIGADRPVTVDRVRQRVPGYPEERASFQRQFERDKAEIREMGLPLETVEIPGTYPVETGYRIARDAAYLRDPGLTPDELAALALAASAVRLEGIEGSAGLSKLGAPVRPGGGGDGIADLPADERLVTLFGAVAECRQVHFSYNGTERTLDPYRLACTRGRWYVSGHDHQRDADRAFRIDRIAGSVTAGPPGTFTRPPGGGQGVRMEPWRFGSGPEVLARVLVDDSHVEAFRAAAPSARVVGTRPGGTVLELAVTDEAGLRSLVLGFLEHAELLGPPELRAALVEWLRAVAETGGPQR